MIYVIEGGSVPQSRVLQLVPIPEAGTAPLVLAGFASVAMAKRRRSAQRGVGGRSR